MQSIGVGILHHQHVFSRLGNRQRQLDFHLENRDTAGGGGPVPPPIARTCDACVTNPLQQTLEFAPHCCLHPSREKTHNGICGIPSDHELKGVHSSGPQINLPLVPVQQLLLSESGQNKPYSEAHATCLLGVICSSFTP